MFTLFYCYTVHFLPKASKFILPFIPSLFYLFHYVMLHFLRLEHIPLLFSQESSFSLRHHLSSHAHTGGFFSLTQALRPIFPFPLPNYIFISLSLPLPFLPISSLLQFPQFLQCCLLIIPFCAHISGSPSLRQLQHTQLSTVLCV